MSIPIESSPDWSESYYFNGYDPELALGFFARIAIRPENVRLATGAEATAADVRDVVFQGSFIRVVATLEAAPEISVLARLPAGTEIAEGDRVGLAVDPSRIIVLGD